jgi:GT2 family glycosyltransferase
LDLAGAQFQLVPFFLYAWRSHLRSNHLSQEARQAQNKTGILALQDYCARKNLDWEIGPGYLDATYRAIPRHPSRDPIHVIIPYTLQAVQKILDQKIENEIWITAIDNQSEDTSIADDLKALGVEVLRINEAFNFSRLNNLGVKNSQYSEKSKLLLFLNNDVLLEPNALKEMSLWMDQPKVGMVGARLHYPNGLLQHGGVNLGLDAAASRMQWQHVDYHGHPNHLGPSKIISICDAVTGACLLMKKETFLEVGGFDEVWYTIAYSDTDLAVKVQRLGLSSLYTPYAVGTHYESISRGPGVYEAPEESYWLFRCTSNRTVPQERLKHHVFLSD